MTLYTVVLLTEAPDGHLIFSRHHTTGEDPADATAAAYAELDAVDVVDVMVFHGWRRDLGDRAEILRLIR